MDTILVTRSGRGARRRRWAAGLLAAMLAPVVGCGHSDSIPAYPVYEVKGQVVLADGKPLSGGWISFVPKGDLPVTPSGEIGPDGTFSLKTGGSGEGAPQGDYKVRVEAPQLQSGPSKSRRRAAFPSKYTDEDSSGLVVTVKAESNRLEPIVLK
jgi:hypothetical protein